MSEDDIAARATELIELCVIAARGAGTIEQTTINQHIAAVRERRRVVAVECRISGHRLALSCWTEAADPRDGNASFVLFEHHSRLRDDWERGG